MPPQEQHPQQPSTPVPLTIPSPQAVVPPGPDQPYILSYFALRRAAGWTGIALPVVAVVFNLHCVPDSISGSYYTGVRNYFVGSLCAVGIFLLCSVGYKRDTKFSIFAGIMAFLVAFDPCTPPTCCGTPIALPYPLSPRVHATAAILLFLTFAYFCLVLFTRTADDPDGFMPRVAGLPRQKQKRNVVFIVCGVIMLVAMATQATAWLFTLNIPYLVLIVEWVCLWAFGIAWLVKGQQLFADADE